MKSPDKSTDYIVGITNERLVVFHIQSSSVLKTHVFDPKLQLRQCSTADHSNFFCSCEQDNLLRKIMLSQNFAVTIVPLPEISLINKLLSSKGRPDLLFVQTVQGVSVFDFKLKAVMTHLENEVTKSEQNYFLKVSERYLVFLSKSLGCFLFYDLRDFRQGVTPAPRFPSCVSFYTSASLKISSYTENPEFFGSYLPLIVHDSTKNYLSVYDLSRPFSDLLYFSQPIFTRNKLEYIKYQIHRPVNRPDKFYLTVANPSFTEDPLSISKINLSFSFQTDLPENMSEFRTDAFDARLKFDLKGTPSSAKEYIFRVTRDNIGVKIIKKDRSIENMTEEIYGIQMSSLFSLNSLAYRLTVSPKVDLNDFVSRNIISPGMSYANSLLDILSPNQVAIQDIGFLVSRSLLILLSTDSLYYFTLASKDFRLLSRVPLVNFFVSNPVKCFSLLLDGSQRFHVLCDDKDSFSILQIKVENIYLPSRRVLLFNSQKNDLSGFHKLGDSKFIIFGNSDPNARTSVFGDAHAFFIVYNAENGSVSAKIPLTRNYDNLLKIFEVKGNVKMIYAIWKKI